MTSNPAERRIVPCPTCRGDSVFARENPFRPFCSARCKNNDFGAWAGEAFRVAASAPRAEDEPDAPAGEPH
jgi:hypothetical protein